MCAGYPELAEARTTSNLESEVTSTSVSASTSLPPSPLKKSDVQMAAENEMHDGPPEDPHGNGDRKENNTVAKRAATHSVTKTTSTDGENNTIASSPTNNNPNLYPNPNPNNIPKTDPTTTTPAPPTAPSRFNSALLVSPTGSTLYNYQKRFLYYTDECWAAEGRSGPGFLHLQLPSIPGPNASPAATRTAIGICMDINPYKFLAPWSEYEFATHVLESGARLVLLPMAWLTTLKSEEMGGMGEVEEEEEALALARRPDLETFRYWLTRFWPLVGGGGVRETGWEGKGEEGDGDVIIVFANRVGVEEGGFRIGEYGDGVARYAGTSCVVGIRRVGRGKRGGPGDEAEIVVWEMLGRAEEGVCFVDTEAEPRWVFRMGGARDDGDDDDD